MKPKSKITKATKVKRGRQLGKWKGLAGRTHDDPRWAKAIERGNVTA